jgi:hypothetical protein
MKFCKDCKHYQAAVACIYFAVPASCGYGDKRDPVTGDRRITGMCGDLRADESKCGPAGNWFDPATLDGRLAMLPEA